MGWVVSWVKVLANYSFWEEAENHGIGLAHFLVFDGWPQNCHDAWWVCHLVNIFQWLPRFLSKESTCQWEDVGLIPGSGSSHREGNGSLLQYSSLGNPMDRGAWQAAVCRVTESARGEAQGLLEITYFAILDLVDSNQLSSYPMAMSFLSLCPAPFSPVS